MKLVTRLVCVVAILHLAALLPGAQGQTNADKTAAPVAGASDSKELNLQVYIDLLRKDVRQQKAEVMGSVMVLDAEDAAKFWPIYNDYDKELAKLNDQRLANIKEYARTYDDMTDAKADELIQNAMSYQKQRAQLLANTYERVKQVLGGVTAARFMQVEQQLLLLIDLQILSSLPVAKPL